MNLANGFSDSSFVVDIILGTDATFCLLDTILDLHSVPLIQESKFGYILNGSLLRPSESINVSLPNVPGMATQTIAKPFTDLSNDHTDNDISVQNLINNSSLCIKSNDFIKVNLFQIPLQIRNPTNFYTPIDNKSNRTTHH